MSAPAPVEAGTGVQRVVHTDPLGSIPDAPKPVRAASRTDSQSAAAAAGPACSSSHPQGFQMVYARPLDVASRLGSLSDAILSDAAAASDRIAAESSSAPKRPRFLCGVSDVQTQRASALYGANPLQAIMDDLAAAGYARSDRKYVVWWDGPSPPGICGEGTFVPDERSASSNYNNEGPDYAAIYHPSGSGFCGWTTVLHEMGHTLGAVMQGAPHSTSGWHCTDENDVMCYDDDGPEGPVTTFVACSGSFIHFDCNQDDYFSPAPAGGSYLATHWNTYNNVFLEAASSPPSSAPDTTITSGPSGSVSSTSASFSFTSTIGGSTFTCSLDGAAGTACTSPRSYSGLSSGSHTFSVFATAAGVADSTPAARTWTVAPASTAPDTTITQAPASLVNSATATFAFAATDAGATFTCTIDSGAASACTSPKSYPGLADGTHTFTVTASVGGIADPTPATHVWSIDTVAPSVAVTAPNRLFQNGRAFAVDWTVSDANSVPRQRILMNAASTAEGFGWYRLWREQSSPGATFVGGPGWTYCFVIEAFDAAGNRSVTPASCTAVPMDDRWTPADRFERYSGSGFFDGTVSVARRTNASMTLRNIRARSLNVTVQMCRACRYMDVYWNGRRIKQMSLATDNPRMVSIGLATFPSVQVGTLMFIVRSPVIVIDSIGVVQA